MAHRLVAGVSWGREIFTYNNTVEELWVMLRLLGLWAGLMWVNLCYSLSFFLPPSRRLANYTFFTWIIGQSLGGRKIIPLPPRDFLRNLLKYAQYHRKK